MSCKKLRIGSWTFHPDSQRLTRGDIEVTLENKQAQLLLFMAQHPARDISKTELLDVVWHSRVVNDDALYVCVANLRKALGDNPRSPEFIKTIPGVGYRWLAPVENLEGRQTKRGDKKAVLLSLTAVMVLLFIGAVATLGFKPARNQGMESTLSQVLADDYREARYLLTLGDEKVDAAMALLEKIMANAPGFADAYALAADQSARRVFGAQLEKSQAEQVTVWIDHALELKPDHALAHLAKANLLFLHHWQFDLAGEHYQRALDSAQSYFDYAQFLLAMGQFERALEYSYRYQDLDPEGYSTASVAWIETMSGRYESALESINKLHRVEPHNVYYHVCRQAIFEQMGDPDRAWQELRHIMTTAGYSQSDVESVTQGYLESGLAGAYGWLLLKDEKQLDIGQYRPPLSLARYAIGAGRYQQAIELLQTAVEQRQVEVLWLAVDPKYQPLHEFPAFNALLQKMGLR